MTRRTEKKNQYCEHGLKVLFAYLTEGVVSDITSGHKSIRGISMRKENRIKAKPAIIIKKVGMKWPFKMLGWQFKDFQDPGCSDG